MSLLALRSRRRRIALGAGAAFAAAFAATSTAHADFTLPECQGALAAGQGATFQNSAFNGYRAVFSQEAPIGCGAAAGALITWTGTGSGAGRTALGQRGSANPTGQRDPGYRWAGVDEPPTPVQRQQIEAGPIDGNGVDVTVADDGKLHVIPVAIGAIAALVRLPDGCTGFGTASLYRQRPEVTLVNYEKAWFGDAAVDTWGELIPGIEPSVGCADQPIKRVVRFDSSGTTFAFKQLLANIDPAHTEWRQLGNQVWPDDANTLRPTVNGGSALANLVKATAGSIGYVDLATARNVTGFTYDDTVAPIDRIFWLPLQRSKGDPDTYDDPQLDANGYKEGSAARGANCGSVTPTNIPTTPAADPTLGDWSAADSTLSGTGYAACTLTYDLAWDDNAPVYCNSAEEQAKARTIKDYLTKGVLSTAGQASLATNDYGALPGSVLGLAIAGASSINWNKGGQGRPCSDQPGPEPTPIPTPTPTPGGGTTEQPPPPQKPSNVFTIASTRTSGTSIRLSLQLPGAGRVQVTSTTKPKRAKTLKLATKRLTATKAGRSTITVTLSTAAKRALRKDKSLKIALKVTFTPTGGTARTRNKSVTIKQPKR